MQLPIAQTITQTESRACIAAASREGCQTSEMRKMANYRRNLIRDMPDAAPAIVKQVNAVAAAFGAREKLEKETMAAAVDLVRQHFGFLAADEIQEAYRMNAAGLLEERAETWGGRFSVDQLGKVLVNYNNWRKRLMAAYLRELENIREEERQAEKREALQRQFEETFYERLRFIADHGTGWEDVPEFWYEELKKRGEVRLTKQKGAEYYERALQIANRAAAEQKELALLMPIEQRFREVFKVEPESYAKTVARKMVVYDLLKEKNFLEKLTK